MNAHGLHAATSATSFLQKSACASAGSEVIAGSVNFRHTEVLERIAGSLARKSIQGVFAFVAVAHQKNGTVVAGRPINLAGVVAEQLAQLPVHEFTVNLRFVSVRPAVRQSCLWRHSFDWRNRKRGHPTHRG